MPKFIYISDSTVLLNSPLNVINYTCVDEPYTISNVTVNPPTAIVTWTQVSGNPITILNANTISPTIVFPSGFNTTNPGLIVLRLDALGATSYITIQINTRLTSLINTPSVKAKGYTYIPIDAIPSGLNYYFQDYYPTNISTSVVYLPSTNPILVTYINPVTTSNFKIIKTQWLSNIGGQYTTGTVSIYPSRSLIYTRGTTTKAIFTYQIGNDGGPNKTEIVSSNILNSDNLNYPAVLGVSNSKINSRMVSLRNSTVTNITKSSYIFNVLVTPKTDTSSYKGGVTTLNNKFTSTISQSTYIFNSSRLIRQDNDSFSTIGNNVRLNNKYISTITKTSYLLNSSGTLIG